MGKRMMRQQLWIKKHMNHYSKFISDIAFEVGSHVYGGKVLSAAACRIKKI
jgi:hypothetical protein